MCNLLKIVLIATLLFLAGCDVDDAADANKYTKPTVNAGSDQVHTLPINTITLHGSAKSWPKLVFSIKTKQWRQISGPQSLTILNADSFTATLLNPTVAGTYIFELYAKDSGDRSNTDQVKIVLREPQPVVAARKSLGYEDDYQQLWQSVATNYPQYDQIQDEWQQLYQPYLIKAAQAQNEEEWQALVAEIFAVLNGPTLTKLTTRPSHKLARTRPDTTSIIWHQENGIGTIEFNTLEEALLLPFSQQLDEAIEQLKGVSEIRLAINDANTLDTQKMLTLMEKFTTSDTTLCLKSSKDRDECLLLTRNHSLSGVMVSMNRAKHTPNLSTLADYFDFQQNGEEQFDWIPPFVFDSRWQVDTMR
ncbi:PKD domain-containing protein [Vibrio vulnificus]|nr:hypothetical protein [Vibrio vulnificus]